MKRAFAVSAKSRKILKKSSSGGVFYILAKHYLKVLNGVVYGATIEGSNVFHLRVDNLKNIGSLLKSKYVRSDLKNTFYECKADLEQGKSVLFVGLPCQIFALHKYLDVNFVKMDKLFLVDLICHGVPNKKMFENYLNNNFPNEVIKSLDFRCKKPFWENYYIKITTNKRKYVRYKFHDEYLSSFLNGINLDNSCYTCIFKGDNRKSIITIGDFWGIKSIQPNFYNNRGTSLLIVNDFNKFDFLIDVFKKEAEINEVPFESAIRYNKSYLLATSKPSYNSDVSVSLTQTKETNVSKIKLLTHKIMKYLCKRV